jgi:hypothetical protein
MLFGTNGFLRYELCFCIVYRLVFCSLTIKIPLAQPPDVQRACAGVEYLMG